MAVSLPSLAGKTFGTFTVERMEKVKQLLHRLCWLSALLFKGKQSDQLLGPSSFQQRVKLCIHIGCFFLAKQPLAPSVTLQWVLPS